MARKLIHIRHDLCLPARGRRPTHAPAYRYCLARDMSLEGSEDQLVGVDGVEHVEAAPIDSGCWPRERAQRVVEERGSVGEITV